MIIANFKKVIDDNYFSKEFSRRKPGWFTEQWVEQHINQFTESFDASLNRWMMSSRKLTRHMYSVM